MPKFNLKKMTVTQVAQQVGTNIQKEAVRVTTKIATAAAAHGNKDFEDAANALHNSKLAAGGLIDTALIPMRKTADDLINSIKSKRAIVCANAKYAKTLADNTSAESQKIIQEIADFQRLQPDHKNQFENKALAEQQHNVATLKDVVITFKTNLEQNSQNPDNNIKHLRALISGATKDSTVDGKLNEDKAKQIAAEVNAKLTKLDSETKTSLDASNNALAALLQAKANFQTLIKGIQDAISAAIASAKLEKEAAELAAKKAAEEQRAKQKAELARKMADLQKQMAEFAQEDVSNQPAAVAGSAGAAVTTASAAKPAVTTAYDAKTSKEDKKSQATQTMDEGFGIDDGEYVDCADPIVPPNKVVSSTNPK